MDRRERAPDMEELLRMAFDAMRGRIWTMLPGIIVSVDYTKMTCQVQPAVIPELPQPDGSLIPLPIPPLSDVAIQLPGGGGVFLDLPLSENDEVMIVLAARCIDGWHQKGGMQLQPERRLHNLSDAVVVPGLRSLPNAKTMTGTVARIRTDDNSCYYELNPSTKALKLVAPGGVTINGVTIDSSGNIANANNIANTGTLTSNGIIKTLASLVVGTTTVTVP
jgi:protein gp138